MEEKQPENKSILLIDDDQFLRDMYSVKFRERGFTVDSAESALDALERLRAGLAPSIIVFDVVMPGLDGYDFLEKLASEKLAQGALKIALSNQGSDADIEKAKSLGAAEYIIKANTIPSEVVAKVLAVASST